MKKKIQIHWNKIYLSNEETNLGWYEERPSTCLGLLDKCDISDVALNRLRGRLRKDRVQNINWIADDLTEPEHVNKLSNVSLWHDRAVLHFLLHEEDRLTYFSTLKKVLKKGGFAIIAAFSLEGARKCSGLKVVNYNEKMLAQYLGSSFKLLETFYYTYSMPSGAARPYIYTLFQMEN